MNKPTYEDSLDYLFDEVIKPFQASHEPIEGQLIYISSASMCDNPFTKMIAEYLKNNTKENELCLKK